MSFYKTCPVCGAHLDPGESCRCVGKEKSAPSAGKQYTERDGGGAICTHPYSIMYARKSQEGISPRHIPVYMKRKDGIWYVRRFGGKELPCSDAHTAFFLLLLLIKKPSARIC